MRRFIAKAGVGLLVLIGLIWATSELALRKTYAIPPDALTLAVEPSPALVPRGRHVATAVAQCQFCHGPDLSGRLIADDPLLGRLMSTNLTKGKGGIGREYEKEDWVRALRYGVGMDGHSLVLMPSVYLARMTDRDLAAVISFLEQVPAVDREGDSGLRVGAVTRIALTMGAADDLLSAVEVASRRPNPGPARAELDSDYLVDVGNCRICHHADLRGGLHPLALPGEPPPSDLRPGGAMTGWELADFERAMRSGLTPDGRQLDREFMPWPAYAALSNEEIGSLWNALSGKPAEAQLAERSRSQPLPAVSAENPGAHNAAQPR